MRKEKVSVKMENIACVIGQNTRKHNTVTMRVDRSFILEALDLYEAEREGRDPGKGLVGVELVAVYQDEVSPEQMELPIEDGEPVTGDELIDGMRLSTEGTCNDGPILTTAVKDQDKANEAFQMMDKALGIALEE